MTGILWSIIWTSGCSPEEDKVGCATDADCSDGIACTIDACETATGTCSSIGPDTDGDGLVDAMCLDEDGQPLGIDCDDANPAAGDPSNDQDCDGVSTADDCDDTSAAVTKSPDADEDADGIPCAEDCNDQDARSFARADDSQCDGLADCLEEEFTCFDVPSPVVYYPFDQDDTIDTPPTGFLDRSGRGFDLDALGDVVTVSDGVAGEAAAAGDGFASAPFVAETWTIAGWVRGDLAGTDQVLLTVSGETDETCERLVLRTAAENIVGEGATDTCDTVDAMTSADGLTAWHHIAFSFDGADARLYVDGEPRATVPNDTGATSLPWIAQGRLTIGFGDSGTPFGGDLDELVLFDTALDDGAIRGLLLTGRSGAALSVGLPPTCVEAPDSLVAHWPFNGDALDLVNANDGVETTTPAPNYVDGLSAAALALSDASDHVYVDHAPEFDLPGSFTFDVWIRHDAPQVPFARVFSKYRCGGTDCDGFDEIEGGVLEDGSPYFYLRDGEDPTGTERDFFVGNANLNDGAYHHVAWVRDLTSDELLIYVDGEVDSSQPIDVAGGLLEFTADDPLLIGAQQNCNGCEGDPILFTYAGEIDEFRMFDAALTADEIRETYEARAAGTCPD